MLSSSKVALPNYKAVIREINRKKSEEEEPLEYVGMPPPWVLLFGLGPDALYLLGAIILLCGIFKALPGLFGLIVTGYCVVGFAVFLYRAFAKGEIGAVGYHLGLLLWLVLWPLLVLVLHMETDA